MDRGRHSSSSTPMDGFQPGNIQLGLLQAPALLFPGRSCGCKNSSGLARVANSASRSKCSTCSTARISPARMASNAVAAIRTSASPTAWPARHAAFQFGADFSSDLPSGPRCRQTAWVDYGGRKVGAFVMLTRRELGGLGAALSLAATAGCAPAQALGARDRRRVQCRRPRAPHFPMVLGHRQPGQRPRSRSLAVEKLLLDRRGRVRAQRLCDRRGARLDHPRRRRATGR